jgi:hypothetical protein
MGSRRSVTERKFHRDATHTAPPNCHSPVPPRRRGTTAIAASTTIDMHMLSPRMLTHGEALVPQAAGFGSRFAEASMDAPTFMHVFDSAMARLRATPLIRRRVTMRRLKSAAPRSSTAPRTPPDATR